MTQTKLSRWLKTILIIVAMLGTLIYFVAIPIFAKEMRSSYPEFSDAYVPWLCYLWIAAIPCYIVLIYGWKIAVNIGKNRSFCMANATALQRICVIAVVDSVYFVVGDFVMLVLGWNHPAIALGILLIPAFGFCVGAAAACLAHLVQKAAVLQDESDLTI